jgi:hypothetical protein
MSGLLVTGIAVLVLLALLRCIFVKARLLDELIDEIKREGLCD